MAHRDVKPENLLLTHEGASSRWMPCAAGRLKLVDFDAAMYVPEAVGPCVVLLRAAGRGGCGGRTARDRNLCAEFRGHSPATRRRGLCFGLWVRYLAPEVILGSMQAHQAAGFCCLELKLRPSPWISGPWAASSTWPEPLPHVSHGACEMLVGKTPFHAESEPGA